MSFSNVIHDARGDKILKKYIWKSGKRVIFAVLKTYNQKQF